MQQIQDLQNKVDGMMAKKKARPDKRARAAAKASKQAKGEPSKPAAALNKKVEREQQAGAAQPGAAGGQDEAAAQPGPSGGQRTGASPKEEKQLSVGCYTVGLEPSLAQFETLAEGEYRDNKNFRILKKENKLWVLGLPPHHVNRGTGKKGTYCSLSGKVMLRESFANSEIPAVEHATEGMLNTGYVLFAENKNGASPSCGPDCDCPPIRPSQYLPTRISNFCEKRGLFRKEEMGNAGNLVSPNASWKFVSTGQGWEMVVPQPHGVATKWEEKTLRRAMEGEGCSFRNTLFYSLIDSFGANNIQQCYEAGPEGWNHDSHPLFSEPEEGSELQAWSRQGYGLESLGRLHLAAHPARARRIPLFSLTSTKTLQTPVMRGGDNPAAIEEALFQCLTPFLRFGQGQVVCAICLLRMVNGRPELATLSRSAYTEHYRRKHSSNIVACSLHFATHLQSRSFEALAIYMALSSDILGQAEDDPLREALEIPEDAGFSYSQVLYDCLVKLGGVVTIPMLFREEELAEMIARDGAGAGQDGASGGGPPPAPRDEAGAEELLQEDLVGQELAEAQDQDVVQLSP